MTGSFVHCAYAPHSNSSQVLVNMLFVLLCMCHNQLQRRQVELHSASTIGRRNSRLYLQARQRFTSDYFFFFPLALPSSLVPFLPLPAAAGSSGCMAQTRVSFVMEVSYSAHHDRCHTSQSAATCLSTCKWTDERLQDSRTQCNKWQ